MIKSLVFFLVTAVIAIIFSLYYFISSHDERIDNLISIWETSDADLRLTPPLPLPDKRPITQDEVNAFINKAVPTAMTLNPRNFLLHQKEIAVLFTKRGFISFYEALEKSQIKKTLEERKGSSTSKLLCITRTTLENDKYNRPVWVAESVIEYTYIIPPMIRKDYQLTELSIMDKSDENIEYTPGTGIRKWFVTAILSEKQAQDKCQAQSSPRM